MHAFEPNIGQLIRFATREHLLPPGGDLGYAFHTVFSGALGELSPKPFAWCAPGTRSGGSGGRVLCYSSSPLPALMEHASSFAEPTLRTLLNVESAASKAMPDEFAEGTRLGFRVRIRPVVRTGKARDGTGGKERDAYIDGTTGREHETGRATCYLQWMEARLLAGGASMEHGTLDSFTLSRIMTRDRSGKKSRRDAPTGPDAVAMGTLTVTDSKQFQVLLGRGVGRFRAFGFGMLLLSPPKSAVR